MSSVEMTSRYELQLRSTTGIPLKMYDPKFEAQWSMVSVSQNNGKAMKY